MRTSRKDSGARVSHVLSRLIKLSAANSNRNASLGAFVVHTPSAVVRAWIHYAAPSLRHPAKLRHDNLARKKARKKVLTEYCVDNKFALAELHENIFYPQKFRVLVKSAAHGMADSRYGASGTGVNSELKTLT